MRNCECASLTSSAKRNTVSESPSEENLSCHLTALMYRSSASATRRMLSSGTSSVKAATRDPFGLLSSWLLPSDSSPYPVGSSDVLPPLCAAPCICTQNSICHHLAHLGIVPKARKTISVVSPRPAERGRRSNPFPIARRLTCGVLAYSLFHLMSPFGCDDFFYYAHHWLADEVFAKLPFEGSQQGVVLCVSRRWSRSGGCAENTWAATYPRRRSIGSWIWPRATLRPAIQNRRSSSWCATTGSKRIWRGPHSIRCSWLKLLWSSSSSRT